MPLSGRQGRARTGTGRRYPMSPCFPRWRHPSDA